MEFIKGNIGYHLKTLPEGSVLISMADVNKGLLKKGCAYMLYSYAYDIYECHRFKPEYYKKLIPFIETNRVYLFPDNAATESI